VAKENGEAGTEPETVVLPPSVHDTSVKFKTYGGGPNKEEGALAQPGTLEVDNLLEDNAGGCSRVGVDDPGRKA